MYVSTYVGTYVSMCVGIYIYGSLVSCPTAWRTSFIPSVFFMLISRHSSPAFFGCAGMFQNWQMGGRTRPWGLGGVHEWSSGAPNLSPSPHLQGGTPERHGPFRAGELRYIPHLSHHIPVSSSYNPVDSQLASRLAMCCWYLSHKVNPFTFLYGSTEGWGLPHFLNAFAIPSLFFLIISIEKTR